MKLIKKYQRGNQITIPQREGYEIKLAKDIHPNKPTMIQDPDYGEVSFDTYQSIFPNDYFYVRAEENDPEQLIIEPTSSSHRMSWYKVPYGDELKFAQGYNQFDATRRNNILSGSLYRQGNPDPTDNALNSALTGVAGLTRYGWKEAGKQTLRGLNFFGKALTPSTYTTALFGTGFNSTIAGLGLDATTFGSMAYGSVKDMIDNGVNVENLLGATMSIPAVASAYNMYKTAKTGKNLYNLINVMNKALEDPEMGLYLYNRASNKDFLPIVHETGIKPEFNATTTVNTKEGKVTYDPEHIKYHFSESPTEQEIINWVENAVSRPENKTALTVQKIDRPIGMAATTDKSYVPVTVEAPPLFPHINYSSKYGLNFEDKSRFGYRNWNESSNTVKIGDEYKEVPNPLSRIIELSDATPESNIFIGLGFNRDEAGNLILKNAYPYNPLIKTQRVTPLTRVKGKSQSEIEQLYQTGKESQQNYSETYDSPIFLNYQEYANRFPQLVWNPSKVTLKYPTDASEQWSSTTNKMLDDIMSFNFDKHMTRELGVPQDNSLIRRSYIRRYTGTYPFGRPTPSGEFPLGKIGPFTFDGETGPEIFANLQKNGKISPNITEEEFFNSLSPEEQTLYKYAKAGQQKILGVELPEGKWGSMFNVATEEGHHLRDIGNLATWMKRIDAHNAKYLPYVQSLSLQLSGKEALPRIREAQRAYRMVEDFLPEYYNTNQFDPMILNRFYRDLARGSSRLYKFFPELKEFHPNENRLIWELNHGYKWNPGLFNALEHIVYNEGSESQDSSMA